jgi:hypothetical protein
MAWENASMACQLRDEYEARLAEVKSDHQMKVLAEGALYSGKVRHML